MTSRAKPSPLSSREAIVFRPAATLIRGAAALFMLCASGCFPWTLPFGTPAMELPDIRFVNSVDLGLSSEPMALDVVYTVHPRIHLKRGEVLWQKPELDPGFDCEDAFHALTQNVLSRAFRTAIPLEPGSHSRLEDLRRAAHSQGEQGRKLPPLDSKALVIVDFRPPLIAQRELPAQLLVQVYDISFPRYEAVSLFHPRLLIFEDFAELPQLERPSKLAGTVVLGWREILDRMRASDRFQRYLALGPKALSDSDPEGALLLGLIPPDRLAKTPDSRGHEWIEKEILFAPPRPRKDPFAGAPPPAPSGGAAPVEPSPAGSPAPDAAGETTPLPPSAPAETTPDGDGSGA